MTSNPTTNGEKLNQMMQDQAFRKKLEESLEKNGHLVKPPVLILEIHAKDGSEYELEEDDIKEVFSRFGLVEKVVIKNSGKALIVFSTAISAAFALNSLNDHLIEDIEVTLKVTWCPVNDIPVDVYDFGQGRAQVENKKLEEKIEDKNQTNDEEFVAQGLQDFDSSNMIKYTCRYEIQIENEREFQVCRKIIGPKGSNMKQIIEFCCQDKHEDYLYYQEQIKLRLRGKGSGYKEGINQMESDDSLHLCVSSRYYDMYIKACTLIERLLLNIYDEYKLFCMRVGRPFDPNLAILKQESTTKGGKFFNDFQPSASNMSFQYPNQQPMYYPSYYPPQQGYGNEFYPGFENKGFYKQNMNMGFYGEYNNNNNNGNNGGMEISEEAITRLIEARNKARKELNFKEADRIRNFLKSKGVALMDEKGARGKGIEVTTWKYIKNGFEGEISGFNTPMMAPQKAFG